MIVISDSVVLTSGTETDPRNPRIGWRNVVTSGNCFATQEDPDHPVEQLANPATYLYWKGENTAEQSIGVQLAAAATVNYVGIARHNFGTTGAQYVIQSSANGSEWNSLTSAVIPPDDAPILHEFGDEFASWYRVLITPDAGVPEVGVLYFGQVLRLQRRIYVGHTPIPFGRETVVSSGFSEEGQFLGRVVRRRMYRSAVSLRHLTPDWYRQHLDPFFHAAAETPFFFAWRPASYPNETGFAWLTQDGIASNDLPNGMMQASFQFQGIR